MNSELFAFACVLSVVFMLASIWRWILPESGRVRSTCFPLPIGLVGGVISEARVGRD
jgi:hypothetical protein